MRAEKKGGVRRGEERWVVHYHSVTKDLGSGIKEFQADFLNS